MLKKLLSIVTLIPSLALADVQVWGGILMSGDYQSNTKQSMTSIMSNGATLGVTAKEDDFVSKIQLGINTSTGTIGGTDAVSSAGDMYVGLENPGYGQIHLGRNTGPFRLIGREFDTFNQRIGDTNNMYQSELEGRSNNSIYYLTPKVNGFTVSLMASAKDKLNQVSGDNGNMFSTGLRWKNSKLNIAYAYTSLEKGQATNEYNAHRYGLSYNLTEQLSIAYMQTIVYVNGIGSFTTHTANTIYDITPKISFRTQYAYKCSVTNQSDARQLSAGVDYNFSKNTTVYADVSTIDNDTFSSVSFSSSHGYNIPGIAGKTTNGVSLGIQHFF